MTKRLKRAVSLAESDASAHPIDEATRAAILEGLAEAERGDYVPDDVVAAADKRHGIREFQSDHGPMP